MKHLLLKKHTIPHYGNTIVHSHVIKMAFRSKNYYLEVTLCLNPPCKAIHLALQQITSYPHNP